LLKDSDMKTHGNPRKLNVIHGVRGPQDDAFNDNINTLTSLYPIFIDLNKNIGGYT
jgi:ferredoxin-NADP reductase